MGDDLESCGQDGGETVSVRLTPEAFAKPPGGVRRSAIDLLAALRLAGADVSVSSFVERSLTPTSPTPSGLKRVMLQIAEAGYFGSQRLQRADGIAHSLYYDQQVRAANWPLVVTVHDMAHERFGVGTDRLRWAKRFSIQRASLIITPSRVSASDLTRIYPGTRAEIITIPWAISPEFLTEARGPTVGVAQPFLLYVGARSGYKNFSVLTHALARARDLNDFRLVVVGGEPLLDNERRSLVDALGARNRIVHLASPTDDVLRRLYDETAALVVTSRGEGFGLPLLEAMARGCPVAAAEQGSSPEVAGGHAAMFSPDSAAACAEAIRQAIALPLARRQAGQLHARRYDWAATAQAHVDAYRSIRASAARNISNGSGWTDR